MAIPAAILVILISLSGLILIGLLFLWSTYNNFIRSRNQVKTDYSDIDIQVKRKASLVEKLMMLTKEYAKHEKDTFENVAKARSALDSAKNVKDTAKAENMLSNTLRQLYVVVESYPKLQANDNYKNTIEELKQTEDKIARYREEYNLTVQSYNNQVQTFPNLLAARLLGFESEDLFQEKTVVTK